MSRSGAVQLTSLRTKAEHGRANRALVGAFARGAACAVKLYEGAFDGYFLAEHDLWLAPHQLPNRYRNALGPGDPRGRRSLSPSVQLNLALAPGSARPKTRFARDAAGALWIAHTGTLGGRQPGISRDHFLTMLPRLRTEVVVDGEREMVLLLGRVDRADALLRSIADLVHTAHHYRSSLASGLSL